MKFSELKPGNTVWIFDQSNITCEEGKIESVSIPRYENKIGMQPSMVVDVTISGGSCGSRTYVFPSDSDKAWCGGICYCVCKDDVLGSIKSIKEAHEVEIGKYEARKDAIAKCNALLAEIDTEMRDKMQMESRLTKIEGRFDRIEELMERIAGKI